MIDYEVILRVDLISSVGLISSIDCRSNGGSVFEFWVFEGFVWLRFGLWLVIAFLLVRELRQVCG